MNYNSIYTNPIIWGPSTWYVIHILGYTYNEDNIDQYKRFFDIFKKLIPCQHCKKDYNNYIELIPIDLSNKKNFIKWTSNLHNYVNRKLNKKQYNQGYIDNLYLNADKSLRPIKNNEISHFIALFTKSSNGNNCQELLMSLIRIYPDKNKKLEELYKMDNNIVWKNPVYVKLIVRSISLKIL